MNDYRSNETVIVENLKDYLSTENRLCEVVRQNQVAETPDYPYVSYTVITPVSPHSGTYSEAEDGTLYKDIIQTWSFTVQSNDQEEAMTLAMRAYDFFTAVGLTVLADNGIAVMRVQGLTTRDNMISIEYEYRVGLDVSFGLLYVIAPKDFLSSDVIENFEYEEE